jgi:hypothetical protein
MDATDLRIRVLPAIVDVAAAEWDACANPGAQARTSTDAAKRLAGLANCPEAVPTPRSCDAASPAPPEVGSIAPSMAPSGRANAASHSRDHAFNPFIAHSFLSALEASG